MIPITLYWTPEFHINSAEVEMARGFNHLKKAAVVPTLPPVGQKISITPVQ